MAETKHAHDPIPAEKDLNPKNGEEIQQTPGQPFVFDFSKIPLLDRRNVLCNILGNLHPGALTRVSKEMEHDSRKNSVVTNFLVVNKDQRETLDQEILKERKESKDKKDEKITSASRIYRYLPEHRKPHLYPNLEGKQAVNFYRKVLSQYPDQTAATLGLAFWIAMGETQRQPGDDTIVKLSDESAHRMAGVCTLSQELSNHPTSENAANCLYYIGKLVLAKRLRVNDTNFPPELNFSLTVQAAEFSEQAAAEIFSEVLKRDPHHRNAKFELARMIEQGKKEIRLPDEKNVVAQSASERAAECYRGICSTNPPHPNAAFQLANLVYRGEVKECKGDFAGVSTTKGTILDRYRAYIAHIDILSKDQLLEEIKKAKKDIQKEEKSRQILADVSTHQWPVFIREMFVEKFDKLPRSLQCAMLYGVGRAPWDKEVLEEYFSRDEQVQLAKRKNLLVAGGMAAVIAALALGGWSYAMGYLPSTSSISSSDGADLGLLAALAWLIIIGIFVGMFIYRTEAFFVKAAEKSCQDNLMVNYVKDAIVASGLPEENRQIFNQLLAIPDNKWPVRLKTTTLDEFWNDPEKRAAISSKIRTINDQEFSVHSQVKTAQRIEKIVPLLAIALMVPGAGAMYETSRVMDPSSDTGSAILLGEALLLLIVIAFVYYLLHKAVSGYAQQVEQTVKTEEIIRGVEQVLKKGVEEVGEYKMPQTRTK